MRGRHPRLHLALSIATSLAPLAVIKYSGLAVETLNVSLMGVGLTPLDVPSFFLPLGISFYSFQMLALSIDAFRGRLREAPGPGRYLLFVSFFPQLIAGPILRGGQILPQFARGGERTPERNRRGLWLIASGLGKKVLLADFLLAPFVDRVFASAGVVSGPYHWMAAYAFTFQIYFDFSGYSDMARGIALLLGYELPLNFKEPFLSRSPAEFWRRWHITLSEWLRDYLYIPLGGNRGGTVATFRNLGLTMLLGGLWHGATWSFVIWGGLHGLWLAAHRAWAGARRGAASETIPLRLRDGLRIGLCFHAVVLLFVVFRAPTFEVVTAFFDGLAGGGPLTGWPVFETAIVMGCALLHGLERGVRTNGLPRFQAAAAARWWGPWLEGSAFGLLVGLCVAASGSGGAFIYFQF